MTDNKVFTNDDLYDGRHCVNCKHFYSEEVYAEEACLGCKHNRPDAIDDNFQLITLNRDDRVILWAARNFPDEYKQGSRGRVVYTKDPVPGGTRLWIQFEHKPGEPSYYVHGMWVPREALIPWEE